MTPVTALIIACLVTAAVSVAGGAVPLCSRLSHRWMQVLLSLVAGVMAGVAVLDIFPHAVEVLSGAEASCGHDHAHDHAHDHGHAHGQATTAGLQAGLWWALGGFMAMYLLERFVCFHHHDVQGQACCEHAGHGHRFAWTGALTGLSVHALLAGAGLAAAVAVETASAWPGLGMLLAIAVHKPFDGLAIVVLMERDGRSARARWGMNAIYALVTPAGIVLGWFIGAAIGAGWSGPVLALTAGILLCIALSDVLPELQFHAHDRLILSLALMAGLGIAAAAAALH